MTRPISDISGQRFGRLQVLSMAGKRHRCVTWLCRCDCGNEKTVKGTELIRGMVKSCGCLRRETYVANMRSRSGAHGARRYHTLDEAWADVMRNWARNLQARLV